ncbi:membrane integrity-associated transporter subunit PqiC [Pectobacterium parvum]|uniref:Membrane integrity-associated transporter subunit PqiC n=1 Tax=Pectobacterium parvum TaxID=2778550 RepID=A0AAP9IL35_9GAMM|nr:MULTISPECIES: membrane integrity-associated transporter subunit PqiC [Pectobacterium]GKW40368.1 lipoprotein [Pectobacterium carotovorum subsp. carotovorum]KFX19021.1 membrane protein [Pectobacterium parvum]MCU1801574.1 membrane integrity-associated transporter subunit PqiC [Pectobacterium parvum]QHQ25473.1 membrane integrity-associated transporter subunit PqiC [Pectobacterium parvum]UFK37784.1 membrane integrity-associated transporter subunit PqiC [Pectobacterium parvum]
MMKTWTLVLALVLSACSSSNTQKTYYQLPTIAETNTTQTAVTQGYPLWVEHVSVADYLVNAGLVYQTNDVQYVIASNNLWASPLDQQLQQALVTNLGNKLPGWVVTTQPQGSEQAVLNVAVTGFHGRYDGKVIVRGEWMLTYQEKVVKRPFSVMLPQTEDGYDALVTTLAQGWQQVSQSIAQQAGTLK